MHIFSDSTSNVRVSRSNPHFFFSILFVNICRSPQPTFLKKSCEFPSISLHTFDVIVSLEDDVKEVIKYLRETEEVCSDAGAQGCWQVSWLFGSVDLPEVWPTTEWSATESSPPATTTTTTKRLPSKPSSFKKKLGGISRNTMSFWEFFSWVAGKPQTARWVGRLHCQVSTIALWGRSMGAATALLWLGSTSGFVKNKGHTAWPWVGPWIVHYRHIYI